MTSDRRFDDGQSAPDLVARVSDKELAKRKRDAVARLAKVRARGAVPEGVGPEIVAAPARGPVRVTHPVALYPVGVDDFEAKHAGHDGRDQMWVGDAFDVMAGKAQAKGSAPPFSPGQVQMGRLYRAKVERHATAGVKCSSLESVSGDGGGGGSFIDAVLRDGQVIEAMRERIGDGEAKPIKRARKAGEVPRTVITDRALVDAVCLEDLTLADVLRRHGWSVAGKLVEELRRALGRALDRMAGPQFSDIQSFHVQCPTGVWYGMDFGKEDLGG